MLARFLYNLHRINQTEVYPAPWSDYDKVMSHIRAQEYREAEELISTIPCPTQSDLEYLWHYLNARISHALGSFARAEDHLSRAAELSLELGEEATLMWKLHASVLRGDQWRESENMELSLQVERHAANLGWEFHRALARANIAGVLSGRGDAAGAVSLYMACIDPMKNEARPEQQFAIKYNLAVALFVCQQYRMSEEVFHELLNTPPHDGPTYRRSGMLHQLAAIAKVEQRYNDSIELYTQAMSCLDTEQYPDDYSMLRIGIADLAIRINDLDLARQMIAPYEHGLPEGVEPTRMIELATVRMRLFALDGDMKSAQEQFRMSRDMIGQYDKVNMMPLLMDDALTVFKDVEYRLPVLEETVEVLNRHLGLTNQNVSKMVELRTQYERDLAEREVKQQRERTKVIVETQDQVQRAVGRDLHDSVGQDLTLLLRMTQRLLRHADDLPPEIKNVLEDMSTSAARAAGDVRRISHLLAAADVSSTSLTASLAELVRMTQQAMDSAVVQFQSYGDVIAAPDGTSRAVYRAVQSLLQNVMRHSEATRVDVQLFSDENELRCTVEDNGRGFDPAIVTRGLGMREITARMESVGGEVVFDSRPGHGTFVSLSVTFRQPN